MKRKKKKQLRQPKHFKKGSGYERIQHLRFLFPWPLVALCRITDTTPATLLRNFVNDLSHDSWRRQPDDAPRSLLLEYFILQGYGQDRYSAEDIRMMFQEINAIGMLWPDTNKMKLIDQHARWRDSYQDHWFKKWYYKIRRRKPV